jgi:serine/threonine protein kinase
MDSIKPELSSLNNGRYQVKTILGAGGFGITYQCFDAQMRRNCAVKEYLPDAIASRNKSTLEVIPAENRRQEYLHGKKRFLEEAAILGKMQKIPYVVNVWNIFEENNTAYYVMEYLDGRTLKQLIYSMGGHMPFSLACECIEKTGVALDTVHREAGIFHRDVSPENIMIMPDGSIKLIDFGNAKFLAVKENQHFSVVLKPGFAPPEQYSSSMSQGSFTDVYALAGTFYYAASGRTIPTAPDRVMGSRYEPLEKLVPECSHELSDAVDRALTLDQKFRTQTVSEFVASLQKGRGKLPVYRKSAGKAVRQQASKPQSSGQNPASARRQVPRPQSAGIQPSGQNRAAAWQQAQRAQGYLLVKRGKQAGKRFPIPADCNVTIGRSAAKCQVVLTGHPEISGVHCSVYYDRKHRVFYMADQSTNGLYYRGIRLEKGRKYRVLPGEQIGIGSMRCVITLGEA